MALRMLRKSHRRAMPSYEPTMTCGTVEVRGQTRQDGVAGCMSVPIVLDNSDPRRSKIDTVRSVDAANNIFPSFISDKSSIGRSATVMVFVHTPASTSQ